MRNNSKQHVIKNFRPVNRAEIFIAIESYVGYVLEKVLEMLPKTKKKKALQTPKA